ncbi:MAG: DegT/DnrJ/EryC1/StrS aminotransferase family protein [Verrucomicrobiota bacterium]
MNSSAEPFLPFAKPAISAAAIAEVTACLESGWITTGPRTKQFEKMLQEYVGAPSAQACSSATAGLLMALLSLDLQPGEEVITTPMTFAATLNTIVLAGGVPVLVDVEPGTYNMDVTRLAKAITPRTRAIMPVHFAGLPVDLDPLYELARQHKLRVIEDAAHSIGATYKGRKLGSFGDTQVFSFHPNKNMTTGEGGCVVTRDEAMVKRITLLRFHGIDREAWARFHKGGSPHYEIVLAGYKFNFMDLQAALGIHQLPELDGFNRRRGELVNRYYEHVGAWKALTLPSRPSYEHTHAWHLFAPLINPEVAGLDRDQFIDALKEHNVGTGVHYRAIHLSPFYQDKYGFKRGDFPNAEAISDRVVSLPLFPTMTEHEQNRVIRAMAAIFKLSSPV